MASSRDQTRVGRTLTLGGGAESSLEGRDIELSVSPKDIRTSPYESLREPLRSTTISGGGPMVRIRFPPAQSLVTPRPHEALLGRMETPGGGDRFPRHYFAQPECSECGRVPPGTE
jgi:hypothetical protein